VIAAAVAGAPALGTWIVVADPLRPSDAIFVLDGYFPTRELEGAALYHRGLAPIVAISLPRDPVPVARRLARLPAPQESAVLVLRNLNVPDRAIVRLDRVVQNTKEELALIKEVSRARGFRRVILVTSPSHTRRVRMIWDARPAITEALVHPNGFESFDGRRWWRSRRGIEEMVHELGGMANFLLGSRVPTFDDSAR